MYLVEFGFSLENEDAFFRFSFVNGFNLKISDWKGNQTKYLLIK